MRYQNRYHPTKDPGMKECIAAATETLRPPIVVPWNPRDNSSSHRGGYRGGGGRGGGGRG